MQTISNLSFRKIAVFVMAFTVLVTGFQWSTFETQANANVQCAGQSVCLGTVAGIVVGGGSGGGDLGGGGPVSVGPGGRVEAPSIPIRYSKDGQFSAQSYQLRVEFVGPGQRLDLLCWPKEINGFMVKAAGYVVTWRHDALFLPYADDSEDGWGYNIIYDEEGVPISSTCVYPQMNSVTIHKSCILGYNASIDRMAQSRLGAANGIASKSESLTSIQALEEGGIDNCVDNKQISFFYDPPAGQNAWGQYRATSRIDWATCKFTTTSFDGVEDRIGDCNNQYSAPGTEGRITLWCDGAANGWILKSWTGVDCINEGATQMKCEINEPAKYNGYAGNVQALRDGNDGTLQWANPTIRGGWGDTNWRSSTFINAGSTPRKAGVGDNDASKQLFRSSIPFSSNQFGMISGKNLDQKLAFYTAGDSGAPFKMTRNYLFDGWSNTRHVEFRGYNIKTGQIVTSSYLVPTFSVNNACGPQQSPNISVIRAIGDKVG